MESHRSADVLRPAVFSGEREPSAKERTVKCLEDALATARECDDDDLWCFLALSGGEREYQWHTGFSGAELIAFLEITKHRMISTAFEE